jgi:type II secretory pathway pseudopilin PulG
MKRMRVVVASIVVASLGCHKDGASGSSPVMPGAPASTAELDALWALAPANLRFGLVVSPRAVAMLDHAWHDVHAFARTLPMFAPLEKQLATALAEVGRPPDATLADFGLGPSKGAAMFVVGDGDKTIGILPVVDRAKFVAATKSHSEGDFDRLETSWCKPVAGGYYACADKREDLQSIGNGNEAARSALAAAKARGEIEVVLTAPIQLAVVAQLARGAVVVRGMAAGLPEMPPFGPAAQPRIGNLTRTGGFAIADVSSAIANVPHVSLGGAVHLDEIAHALRGPVQITTDTGELALDASIALRDSAPIETLLEHCAELGPLQALGAKFANGTCHIPVPQAWLALDATVDHDTLHITSKAEGASPSVAASTFGTELAGEPWTVAFWGRGTMFAPSKLEGLALAQLQAQPEMLAGLRAFAILDELGMAVRVEGNTVKFVVGARTMWANPDDVVAKLAAITVDDLVAGRAADAGKAIAAAAPSSPFASDYTAGYSGLTLPSAVVGTLAAVAIPTFLDYTRKSKESEASLELNKLGKLLRVYVAEHGAFPTGDAKATPNFPTCCGLQSSGSSDIDNKCPASPAMWSGDKVWQAVDFSISEPTHYRYTYHSDGKTFVATAIGDVDCDGTFATFELHGTMVGDQPQLELVKPPPGVY